MSELCRSCGRHSEQIYRCSHCGRDLTTQDPDQ